MTALTSEEIQRENLAQWWLGRYGEMPHPYRDCTGGFQAFIAECHARDRALCEAAHFGDEVSG